MTFAHGKDAAVYCNGRNLTGYLTKISNKLSCDVAKTTVLGVESHTYIPGLRDAKITADGVWDGSSAAAVDAIFNAALGSATETLLCIYPAGDVAQGDPGYAARAIEVSYDVASPVDNVVTTAAEFQLTGDVDQVVSLHALGAETSAGDLTIYDGSAGTSAGCAAHLHVTDITGTNIIVKVQHGTLANGSDMADLITFTSATAAGTSERKTTASTVNRYLRCNISGTFTSATFAVAFDRK